MFTYISNSTRKHDHRTYNMSLLTTNVFTRYFLHITQNIKIIITLKTNKYNTVPLATQNYIKYVDDIESINHEGNGHYGEYDSKKLATQNYNKYVDDIESINHEGNGHYGDYDSKKN